MHGFAINVDPDMTYMRKHIVPCGVAEYPVTSLREEGFNVSMEDLVNVIARLAAQQWGHGISERQDVAWLHRPEDLSRFRVVRDLVSLFACSAVFLMRVWTAD